MLKRVECAGGLATGVVGILGWVYAAFGPAYHEAWIGLGINSMMFLVLPVVMVGFAACAYVHSQRGSGAGFTLLWLLASALWLDMLLGAGRIGVLLLPATLLAAVTAVVASLTEARRGTAGPA